MRVATKLTMGALLLVSLFLAVLTYHDFLVRHLVSLNKSLSASKFQVSSLARLQAGILTEQHQLTEKLSLTRDPDYGERLEALRQSYGGNREKIRSVLDKQRRQRGEDPIERRWANAVEDLLLEPVPEGSPATEMFTFDLDWADIQELLPEEERAEFLTLLDRLHALEDFRLHEELDRLDQQHRAMLEIIDQTEVVIQRQANQSSDTKERAEDLFRTVTLASLLLTALVGFLTVRSINAPLRSLIRGTQAVTEGRYTFQLDESRGDEFASLASSFNIMVRRLDELDQMKKNFVAHVSHELKAPLAAMRETNQLLLEEIPGPLNTQQRKVLTLNQTSAKRLSAMISKLLDLSRLEAGGLDLDFKPLDLAALVQFALDEFAARSRDRGTHLSGRLLESPMPIYCDGDRLIQVLENLLENAIKFSPRGGAIHLRLEQVSEAPESLPKPWKRRLLPASPDGGYALLQVSDQGIGVPEDQQLAIFEKFHQAGRPQPGGVGLGLAICREIVEAHGGAIWVRDNPTGGSTFSLLLPGGARSRELPVMTLLEGPSP